jgi:hypothetical protein
MLPILIISETSTILPSQLSDETKNTESDIMLFFICILTSFISELVLGKMLLKGIKKAKMASIAKGMLLLVSLISSETLILINISMNKNNIETAPT